MPSRSQKKTLRIRVTIPRNLVSNPIFHTLSDKFKLIHNTLQGRISAKGAWLDVELTGTARNLERALEHLEKLGVTVDASTD